MCYYDNSSVWHLPDRRSPCPGGSAGALNGHLPGSGFEVADPTPKLGAAIDEECGNIVAKFIVSSRPQQPGGMQIPPGSFHPL